nr:MULTISPECIES: hypothetical protein [Pseudomonas syringae group]
MECHAVKDNVYVAHSRIIAPI